MPHVIRPAYDHAAQLVANGIWSVVPERGLVYSARTRRPLGMLGSTGYWYAQFRMGRRRASVRLHRVIWEYVHGPIPDGMEINHLNGTKHDNRLANLELVTPAGNHAHAVATGLQPDQPTGAAGYSAKLTLDQALEIKRRALNGELQQTIADDFGIARSQVSKILHGRQWRELHVSGLERKMINTSTRC